MIDYWPDPFEHEVDVKTNVGSEGLMLDELSSGIDCR